MKKNVWQIIWLLPIFYLGICILAFYCNSTFNLFSGIVVVFTACIFAVILFLFVKQLDREQKEFVVREDIKKINEIDLNHIQMSNLYTIFEINDLEIIANQFKNEINTKINPEKSVYDEESDEDDDDSGYVI